MPRPGILAVTLDRRIAEVLPVLRARAGVVVVTVAAGRIGAREGGLAAGDAIVLHLERRGELKYLAFALEEAGRLTRGSIEPGP